MKKPGKCIHYNGTINDCCKAGVNYKELAGEPMQGYVLRLPCHSSEYRSGGEPLPRDEANVKACDKRQEPTAEEVAQDERQVAERFERFGKIREAIVAYLGGPWKKGMPGRAGSISCPCCNGGCVNFSRAGYNGHIHAACSTPGCASWME